MLKTCFLQALLPDRLGLEIDRDQALPTSFSVLGVSTAQKHDLFSLFCISLSPSRKKQKHNTKITNMRTRYCMAYVLFFAFPFLSLRRLFFCVVCVVFVCLVLYSFFSMNSDEGNGCVFRHRFGGAPIFVFPYSKENHQKKATALTIPPKTQHAIVRNRSSKKKKNLRARVVGNSMVQ